MQITRSQNGDETVIRVAGRVDTVTAPELEAALRIDGSERLVLDLSEVPYMSSAGLRCLLAAQKAVLAGGGSMVLDGVQDAVREVLDITGFSSILDLR